MIVAVPLMRMMQMRSDGKVDMVPVGHANVSAVRSMYVARRVLAASMRGRAARRIRRSVGDPMLVDMIAVHIVQVTVV